MDARATDVLESVKAVTANDRVLPAGLVDSTNLMPVTLEILVSSSTTILFSSSFSGRKLDAGP
ncbi:hypothetical protein CHU95_03510 [Niveispirillum lacus]|uniref:Uncharacterized protein n=1 Tax=Niveispirillum lacus TaxID=1981099 RepID=A0A255Z5U8_9PROT|nr:hypothetical protein CHU95_03510 [Niveispirillum lacus]